MQAGVLSYSGLKASHTDALKEHMANFNKTLSTPANQINLQVLTGSSKVHRVKQSPLGIC